MHYERRYKSDCRGFAKLVSRGCSPLPSHVQSLLDPFAFPAVGGRPVLADTDNDLNTEHVLSLKKLK